MVLRQFNLNVNSTRQFQFGQGIYCLLGGSVNFDEAFAWGTQLELLPRFLVDVR